MNHPRIVVQTTFSSDHIKPVTTATTKFIVIYNCRESVNNTYDVIRAVVSKRRRRMKAGVCVRNSKS